MKNKEAKTTLEAMKRIFSRKILIKPKMSITTDNGGEFKGVFDKFCKDNDIDHRYTVPNRHKQLGNVENLNKQLGRLFNGYMNRIEKETLEPFVEWVDIVDDVRREFNKIKRENPPKIQDEPDFNLAAVPKYKKGEFVYYKLDWPRNALNKEQPTATFRVGDYRWSTEKKKIEEVLFYPGRVPFRYMLNDLMNVSFTEDELKSAKGGPDAETFQVKKIIDQKKERGVTYYLVWWVGYLKKNSTWEAEQQLIEDGLQAEIDKYKATLRG